MKTQRPINKHRRKHLLLRNFALILSVAFLASGSQLSAKLIKGNEHNNTLPGTIDHDLIQGFGGNETLEGDNGNDWLFGDNGDDELKGENGNDWLYGGDGDDELKGENGNDKLFGDNGNDWLYGDNGDDKLFGDNGNDWLYGDNGDDELKGENGNDTLYGANGNDKLYGGYGDDKLFGVNGNDKLFGDNGNDGLYGGHSSKVTMDGGPGLDKFVILSSDAVNETIIANFDVIRDIIDLRKIWPEKELSKSQGLVIRNREGSYIQLYSNLGEKDISKTIYFQPARLLKKHHFIFPAVKLPKQWKFIIEE